MGGNQCSEPCSVGMSAFLTSWSFHHVQEGLTRNLEPLLLHVTLCSWSCCSMIFLFQWVAHRSPAGLYPGSHQAPTQQWDIVTAIWLPWSSSAHSARLCLHLGSFSFSALPSFLQSTLFWGNSVPCDGSTLEPQLLTRFKFFPTELLSPIWIRVRGHAMSGNSLGCSEHPGNLWSAVAWLFKLSWLAALHT